MSTTLTTAQVTSLLTRLRNDRNESNDPGLKHAHALYSYLAANSGKHLICEEASKTVVEASKYLLKLIDFTGTLSDDWRSKLAGCLQGCTACAQRLPWLKAASRTEYMYCFPDEALDNFFNSVLRWELSIAKAKAISKNLTSTAIYHILSNLAILRNNDIMTALREKPPSDPFFDRPLSCPPAGVFLLILDENPELSQWALKQIQKCPERPIKSANLSDEHILALQLIAAALDSSPEPSFSSDVEFLWAGFLSILSLLPDELLSSSERLSTDFRSMVIGHLHDSGPQFKPILFCFTTLIRRLGAQAWSSQGAEFPQVVFDSLKDNHAFLSHLQSDVRIDKRASFLDWIRPFLKSVIELAIYGEILAKVVDFLCEELQHNRFQELCPYAMELASRLLHTALANSKRLSPQDRQSLALSNVLDIHAQTMVAVVFSASHSDARWSIARGTMRDVVMEALSRDISQISSSIARLNSQFVKGQIDVTIPSLRRQLWEGMSTSIQGNDLPTVTAAINLCAQITRFDLLHVGAYKPRPTSEDPEGSKTHAARCAASKTAVNDINLALKQIIYPSIFDTLTKISDDCTSSSMLSTFQQSDVVKSIVNLMMCAHEDIQYAAQGLVGTTFEADTRRDRFRALLENSPDATLDGLCQFLKMFSGHAVIIPEACNLSKSLVRCFTDILEVLCATQRGLLHTPLFLRLEDPKGPRTKLELLWKLMTESITVIFKRTPGWSASFDSETMIVWMRDALIFCKDLFAQREIIESAAATDRSTQKVIKKGMLAALQPVLLELCKWLRLTDQELLYQSFSLLQNLLDCFYQTKTRPSEEAMNKLKTHIAKTSARRTQLDASRIRKLEDAISAFDENDDDVQIVGEGYNAPVVDLVSEGDLTSEPEIISEPELMTKAGPSRPSKSTSAKEKSRPAQSTRPKTMTEWLGKSTKPQPPPMKSSSRTTAPKVFTSTDKVRLDTTSSMPSFRKKATSLPHPPPSRTTTPRTSDASSRQDNDSSDDASSDDGEGGLTQLSNMQKPSKLAVKPPVPKPRRQIKVISDPRLTVDPMQEKLRRQNEARRKQARRNPDISSLHKMVLAWNYDFDGADPPSFDAKKLCPIPESFKSYEHYRSVFEPLLLLECWSQIIDSKNQNPEVHDFKIVGRRFVDDWIDLDVTPSGGPMKKDWYLNETDVVLLRHPEGKKCIMAKVQQYKSTPMETQVLLRCFVPSGAVDPGLQMGSVWRLSKIFSLSTLHREYAALMGLAFVDCENTVYSAQLQQKPAPSTEQIRRTMNAHCVNEPQARAVCSSLDTEGFTLVQGPPGTGKTSTICALIDAFMAARPRPATAVNVGRASTAADRAPPQKILICAPSNAAIDEVALRIRDGSNRGKRGARLSVVRVGAESAINVSVKDISLDNLVEQKMALERKPDQGGQDEETTLRVELDAIKREREKKMDEKSNIRDNSARVMELDGQLRDLNTKRKSCTQRLDQLRDRRTSERRSLEGLRRKHRAEILNEADVICSTLSGSGHDQLDALEFEMIIIDEAAQAVEISSLIPLKFNTRRCVMVGDPQQLPPTVLSDTAKRYLYDQSLFVRLHRRNPGAAHLLSIQYRMHPTISRFPSQVFYGGALHDGPDMAEKTKKIWHDNPRFGTYRFFDVKDGREETTRTFSFKNALECQTILALYARLRQEYSSFDFDSKVGIVSMYKAQIMEIRRAFTQRYGQDIIGRVDFNTVDGFQGQEKDIIILSCVRAGPGVQHIGFLSDRRRINVAMTRAKSSLFIVGHAATLERSDRTWKAIVSDAKERKIVLPADPSYFTSSNLPRVTAAPPSPVKKKAEPLPVLLPNDLRKPQDIKISATRRPSSSAKIDPPPTQTDTPMDVDKGQRKPKPPSPEGIKVPQKRKADNGEVSSSVTPESAERQPPAAKRVKKKAANNLFIPKAQQAQVKK